MNDYTITLNGAFCGIVITDELVLQCLKEFRVPKCRAKDIVKSATNNPGMKFNYAVMFGCLTTTIGITYNK